MYPYLGGIQIRSVEWIGRNAIEIVFRRDEFPTALVQAYAGRRLAAVTDLPSDRSLIVAVPAGSVATPLWLLNVEPEQRATDYGDVIDTRPWNQYRAVWTPPAAPAADLSHYDVVMSRAAGEDYDDTHIVGRVKHVAGASSYSLDLPVMDRSGEWQVAVIPRDNTAPAGNAGTPVEATITAAVYPKDFALDAHGRRFTLTASGNVLTASVEWSD